MPVSDYMSTREAADQWGYTMQAVIRLCALDRVGGAGKVGHAWIIPRDAARPSDARITSGRWIGYKPKYRRNKRRFW
jgi:hypothetical protein